MSLFQKLLALVSVALPLPAFSDVEAVKAWFAKLNPALADLISALANQFKLQGFAAIELPNGEVVTLARRKEGCDGGCDCCLTPEDAARLTSAMPGKWGDGKFLEIIQKLLPIILQILPIFLEPKPSPEPSPAPAPSV